MIIEKNSLQKISSIVGICVFCGLIFLINRDIKNKDRVEYHGPFVCEKNMLVLRTIKSGETNQIQTDILRNGIKINTQNYVPGGIKKIHPLPWEKKCEPIIIDTSEELVDEITPCLRKIVETKQQLSLCGVAYFDSTVFQ